MLITQLKPVFDGKGDNEKRIGDIMRDQNERVYYVTFRYRDKGHYFDKYDGFAIDFHVLKRLLIEFRIDHVLICYRGEPFGERWYYSKMDDWFLKGISYGKQSVLMLRYMKVFEGVQITSIA